MYIGRYRNPYPTPPSHAHRRRDPNPLKTAAEPTPSDVYLRAGYLNGRPRRAGVDVSSSRGGARSLTVDTSVTDLPRYVKRHRAHGDFMSLDFTASISASGLDFAVIRRPVEGREKDRHGERAGLEYVDASVDPSIYSSDVDGEKREEWETPDPSRHTGQQGTHDAGRARGAGWSVRRDGGPGGGLRSAGREGWRRGMGFAEGDGLRWGRVVWWGWGRGGWMDGWMNECGMLLQRVNTRRRKSVGERRERGDHRVESRARATRRRRKLPL